MGIPAIGEMAERLKTAVYKTVIHFHLTPENTGTRTACQAVRAPEILKCFQGSIELGVSTRACG